MKKHQVTENEIETSFSLPKPGRSAYALGVLSCGVTLTLLAIHQETVLFVPSILCVVAFVIGFAMQEPIGEAIGFCFYGLITIGFWCALSPWELLDKSLIYILVGTAVSKIQIGIWKEITS